MTLSTAEVNSFADRLVAANRDRNRIDNLSIAHASADVNDAYAISARVMESVADVDPRIGYKIGLTSKAAQESAGVSEPDYGFLRKSMLIEDGGSLESVPLFLPSVEPELAFIVGDDFPARAVTGADVRSATAEVALALEVIDSRYAGQVNLVDSIADNASTGALVLGPRHTDVAGVLGYDGPVSLLMDGETVASGRLSAVMGDPALAVAWVANRLADYDVRFRPGDIILSGSITRFAPLGASKRVIADFGPLGTVSVLA
jgi:2-keto-4-pentenoate hydratase